MSKVKRKRLKYTCHTCGKKGSKYADEMIEQLVTGRRFCSMDCWYTHRSSGV